MLDGRYRRACPNGQMFLAHVSELASGLDSSAANLDVVGNRLQDRIVAVEMVVFIVELLGWPHWRLRDRAAWPKSARFLAPWAAKRHLSCRITNHADASLETTILCDSARV